MTQLTPGNAVPELKVKTLDGSVWNLSEQTPEHFTIVVFYRGLHCPICASYLPDIESRVRAFRGLGVEIIAVSSDGEARARSIKEELGLDELTIGYDLSIETARDWGLYVSQGIGKSSKGIEEPNLFIEPGIFIIRPDQTLYSCVVQSMPFARPQFSETLDAVQFIITNRYPARGEA